MFASYVDEGHLEDNTRLRQQQDLNTFEKRVLKQRVRTLQSKMHRFACYQRKKKDKATLYAVQRLNKTSLCCWKSYTSFHQTKKNSQAVAQHALCLYLLRKSWHKSKKALSIKQRDKIHMQAASFLAVQSTQRRTVALWRAYGMLCRDKAERTPVASQHVRHHLLRAGLQGFSLSVKRNRYYGLNQSVAVQHHQQRLIIKYWRNDRVEKEDQIFQPQTAMPFSNYSWWAQAEKRKEEALSERAIHHQERCHLLRTWKRWRQRSREKVKAAAKKEALQRLHRRSGELQACLLRDMNCIPVSAEKWKKKPHLQMSPILELSKERFRQQTHCFLREVFIVWWEKASLPAETTAAEQRAESHFKNVLQLKVLVAWREVATHAVSKRHQQGEALSQAQCNMNQKQLLCFFKQWRKQTRDAHRERMSMEKAKCHHDVKILSRAMGMWRTHQSQLREKTVMKRQGTLLLRLKMFQTYFELWKTQLQHRQKEAKQTERALWHWSLTLQAKVLFEWRLFATEQRRRREELVKSAQIYRDQLLREGVTCILTYAAHMNDLTTSMTQFTQKQRFQNLHQVVRRCAMRWKQRALSKPPKEQNIQALKRSVTFCLTAPEHTSIPSSDRSDHEAQGGASSEQHQDFLLPPSAFMIPKNTGVMTHLTQKQAISSSDTGEGSPMPLHQFISPITCHTSTHPEKPPMKEPVNKTEDASALMRELLHIQLDMKSFQQSRKQLRAWRKLRELLQSWLQLSGDEDESEKEAVYEELKELEERIGRISTVLEKRKAAMLLHAKRIQQLQSALCSS